MESAQKGGAPLIPKIDLGEIPEKGTYITWNIKRPALFICLKK